MTSYLANMYKRSNQLKYNCTPDEENTEIVDDIKEITPEDREIALNKMVQLLPILLSGVPYKIAGGYARDSYFGIIPKDIDVFIHYTAGIDNEIIKLFSSIGLECTLFVSGEPLPEEVISKSGYETSDDFEEEGVATTTLSEGVNRVIKVGSLLDIIFVNHSLQKVCSKFDYNINQFELGINNKPTFKGKDFMILKRTNSSNIVQERVNKIKEKARQIGWEVLE